MLGNPDRYRCDIGVGVPWVPREPPVHLIRPLQVLGVCATWPVRLVGHDNDLSCDVWQDVAGERLMLILVHIDYISVTRKGIFNGIFGSRML